ncbi:hypothetical protein FB451DRAFT_1559296 [Mycena latifolia]|nr:hypothetical protein FB451DRAFT_1559296 [Mycena latifolia]
MTVGLATIPLDTQLEILGWIPDFPSLHSCLLLNRTFTQIFTAHRPSLTISVAHNYFGDLLEDALILANTQLERRYSEPKTRGYTSAFLQKLLRNEAVLETALSIVFRFLINNNARMSKWSKEDRDPTSTEFFRFERAAYRFWSFSEVEEKKRSWFLSKFSAIELSDFFYGVKAWVAQMYSPEALQFESEHEADRFSAVLSTGLAHISWLWQLFMKTVNDPEEDGQLFMESIGIAGDGDGGRVFHVRLQRLLEVYRHRHWKDPASPGVGT